MYKKKKNYYILIIILLLVSITFGYAIINSTLNINGKSNISKNTWDVHFDNVQVKGVSKGEIKSPTIDNQTKVDFEVKLDLPGDFYVFTVDLVNDGTIDAMIDSINKTPDLTDEQAKYFDYAIIYDNNELITSKQLVKVGEFVRLKVRVEYKKDISAEDLPAQVETLNLGFSVNYVQSDGSGREVTDNGVFEITANGSLDDIGTIVTIGSEQFYTIGTEGDNVKLLAMYNLYVGNECTSNSSSSCTPYGSDATGKQDSTMLGYLSGQSVRKGITAFSSDTQKGTNYSDYNGSIVEGYVNAYKDILEGEEYGVPVVEARLITKEELTSNDIGCSVEGRTCENAPSFIYSTSYWSGSAYDITLVWRVISYGAFGYDNYYNINYRFGVRPVIVIPKSEIAEQQIIEFTIYGVRYQAEEGMTLEEWIDSKYNVDGYYEENTYILINKDNEIYQLFQNKPTVDSPVTFDQIIEENYDYTLWLY